MRVDNKYCSKKFQTREVTRKVSILSQEAFASPCFVLFSTTVTSVGHLRTLGKGDLLVRKIYAMPEGVSLDIEMQTHSNFMKKKNVHNFYI